MRIHTSTIKDILHKVLRERERELKREMGHIDNSKAFKVYLKSESLHIDVSDFTVMF